MQTSPNITPRLKRRRNARSVWRLYFSVVALASLFVPLFFSFYESPFLQSFLAVILLGICFYPTARYFAHNEGGVPVLAVLCLSYGLQFAIPIFSSAPQIALVNGDIKYLDESDVAAAQLLSMFGVLALQFGYYALQYRRVAGRVPTIDLHLNEKKAVVYCLLVGLLLPFVLGLRGALSEDANLQFSAVFTLLQNQQLVVIGILGWLVYSGRGTRWHRALLYCVVLVTVWRGLSTAFLEQALIPITVLFVTRWLYSKRLSIPSVVAITAIVVFLSPVKSTFRQAVWVDSAEQGGTVGGVINAPFLWIEQASEYWVSTLSGERDVAEATSGAASRTDLIHQFAHIYSLTPEVVPYQHGNTYSYFAVAWIPRALWPSKPQAGGANNFYAVEYGITSEEGAKKSTFGVSLLGEGYINFGPAGVVLIMLLQGCILILLQLVFGGSSSGAGGQAVFLAFFVFFLNGVGTSAEIFFGNIVQNLICSCVLLLWVREKASVRRLRTAATEFTHELLYKGLAR